MQIKDHMLLSYSHFVYVIAEVCGLHQHTRSLNTCNPQNNTRNKQKIMKNISSRENLYYSKISDPKLTVTRKYAHFLKKHNICAARKCHTIFDYVHLHPFFKHFLTMDVLFYSCVVISKPDFYISIFRLHKWGVVFFHFLYIINNSITNFFRKSIPRNITFISLNNKLGEHICFARLTRLVIQLTLYITCIT